MSRRIGSGYLAYEIIGRGATGTVWRGEGPDGPVAVKVLRPELADDEGIVLRFVRERWLLTRLRHPHLVTVRDLVAEGDTLALVLDLVDGPSLRARLDGGGPLAPAEAADTVACVAEALRVVHAAGVLHRDLKPENVLLAGDERAPRPMLTDFGVARLTEGGRVTQMGGVVGTVEYLAPESAAGSPPTPAVDVYAAGVLLYELVCGSTPFGAPHPAGVLHRHLSEAPRRIDGVPEVLWTIISRCLAKQPAQRPDAAELARVLRAAAADLRGHPPLGISAVRQLVEPAPLGAESATHLGRSLARRPAPTAARRRGRRWRPRAAVARLAAAALAAARLATTRAAGVRVATGLSVAALGVSALAATGLAVALAVGGATTARPARDDAPPTYRAATGWLCPEWPPGRAKGTVSVRPCILARKGVVAAIAQTRQPTGAPPTQVQVHLVRVAETETVVVSGHCVVGAKPGTRSGCGPLRHPLDGDRYFAVAVIADGRDMRSVASPIVAS